MAKKRTSNGLAKKRPAKKGATFDVAFALAAELPDVVEAQSYGTRALKVGKTLLARLKEDGETLVLKMDMVSRDYILREQPDVFYLTDHYRDYPYVLVRLAQIDKNQLRDLLEDAWRLAAPRRTVAAWDAHHKETNA
jgi:hypothetical protein